jgi:hypothetical protein
LEQVASVEAFRLAAGKKTDTEADGPSSSSFTGQLLTKLIDNIQIIIEDVQVIYSDTVSIPKVAFYILENS